MSLSILHKALFICLITAVPKEIYPDGLEKIFRIISMHNIVLFKNDPDLETQSIENLKILVSSPEQAALELLALTPHAFDYEHAAHLIENLHFLRPELLQKLLQECTSIKVKRLFLYLAEKYQLPCFIHLKINQIDLGKGKRMIGQGGEYISTYQISVPKLAEESR